MNDKANINEDGSVTISKEFYESLVEDEFLLLRLQGAGVDNWSGYEYAFDSSWEDKSYSECFADWKRDRGLTD